MSYLLAKESLNTAGIGYGASASKKDAGKSQEVFNLIRGMVDAGYEENGKPPSTEEIKKELVNLFTKGEMDGSGTLWDDTGHSFELRGKEGEFRITDVPGVPKDKIEQISKALKASGKEVNGANIKTVFDAHARKNGK